MKEKILMLIIGALLGAIITAGCFMLFSNAKEGERPGMDKQGGPQMGNMVPGQMPQDIPTDSSNNLFNNTM